MDNFHFDGPAIDPDEALKHAKKYSEQAKKKDRNKFREFLHNVGVLGRMAKAVASGEYALQAQQIALLFGTLGYVVSPIDLVPEAVLGPFGLGDDITATGIAVSMLAYEIACFLDWERTGGGVAGGGVPVGQPAG